MPPLATVIVAEAAVYAFVCLYYVMLYARRREHREYLAFGLCCGAFCVTAVGGALITEARDVWECTRGLELKSVGVFAAGAFTVELVHRLAGRPRKAVSLGVAAWALVAFGATVSGALFDPRVAAHAPTWGLAAAPDYYEPALTRAGDVVVVLGWVFVAHAIWTAVRGAALRGRRVRGMVWATAAMIAAASHDIAILVLSLRSVYLVEHAALVSVVAMSMLLFHRVAAAGDALAAKTAELSRSYRELEETETEVVRREQLVAVGELAAVIAHEVRNPLAIIKNAVAELRRGSASGGPGAREDEGVLLHILDEEVDRLADLVDDLLTYARPTPPQPREVFVEEIIERAVELARRGAATTALNVDLSFSGPARLRGDPDLLRQALVNVCDNALQAMPQGGTLSVRTRATELSGQPGLAIVVQDTGTGMDLEVRERALDPFFTTRTGGAGLGLAIVDRVVQAHRGRLDIASDPARGTTITLELPLAESTAEATD